MIGKQLGHYEVLAKLGAGGMGEVYRARDTRLHREVAIKVIPPRLLGDEAHRARFEREARLLASLNHSHIAAIHGLEEEGSEHFLVLEFVDGKDLDERLQAGPMSVEDVIGLARQVAEAVDAAHRQGIIHRDLKPSNIALTSEGEVKVLDFGLAKAFDAGDEPGSVSASQSPTLLGAATASSVILGTAAYMSPEQARGSAVDHRTDIWAFGCVLFECLCGRRAFEGASISDTLAAVLRDPIEFDQLPPRTPPALRRLLQRCLERDPDRRLHSLADAAIELDDAEAELREGVSWARTAAPATSGAGRWWGWGAAAVLAVAFGWNLLAGDRTSAVPAPVVRFTISADSLEASTISSPVISPDGRRVAYAAAGRLWLRELDQLNGVPLAGTERGQGPFWSPDSQNLGFHRGRQMFRLRIGSGEPLLVCEMSEAPGLASRAVWQADDRIAFCSGDGPIFDVPASGGVPRTLLAMEPDRDDDFHAPSALPDGRGLVYVPHFLGNGASTLEVLHDGTRTSVWESPGEREIDYPVWDRSGHVLFLRQDRPVGIWALPFSLERLQATGDAFPVALDGSAPSVSLDGTLVYVRAVKAGQHSLVRVSLDGAVDPEVLATDVHLDDAAFSPSGNRLLYSVKDAAASAVIVRDLLRGTDTVAQSGTRASNPFWISDTQIGFLETDSARIVIQDLELVDGTWTLFRAETGHQFTRTVDPPSAADGFLTFTMSGALGDTDVWLVSLDEPSSAHALVHSTHKERGGQLSPDASMLAWASDEPGQYEVYLAQLGPDGELGPRRWQVSSVGGVYPRWSRDGSRIYYCTDDHMMEVEVRTEGGLSLGRPRQLFEFAPLSVEVQHGYCVSPDDAGFVFTQVGGTDTAGQAIVVVQNWYEEFRGR